MECIALHNIDLIAFGYSCCSLKCAKILNPHNNEWNIFDWLADVYVQVAWIKADAKAILAIHEHVITNSDRLSVTHNDFNTWTLVIRNVRMEDRGQQ